MAVETLKVTNHLIR